MSVGYQPQPAAPKSKVLPILLGCAIVSVVLCGGTGLLGIVYFANAPEGGVRMSNEMEPYAVKYLDDHGILEDGEKVVAYYDVTLGLSGKEAAILTDSRLLYHKNGTTTGIALAEVDDVQHHKEPLIGDVIEVRGTDGTRLKIEIAPLNGGESFVRALNDAVEVGD